MNAWKRLLSGALLCGAAALHAQDRGEEGEVVELSGMSIIGNRELPKTLFIVPWKNAEAGMETELTNTLNEGLEPLDPEVFQRELRYHDFVHGGAD
ncbi:MAG: hypothetical protein KatS3mg121_0276 [Gammaproteobacteria bacterium]|nr:MAG: hypothetical protein KatS3mg121_0276 [Gammaproteobacteria bacterium]